MYTIPGFYHANLPALDVDIFMLQISSYLHFLPLKVHFRCLKWPTVTVQYGSRYLKSQQHCPFVQGLIISPTDLLVSRSVPFHLHRVIEATSKQVLSSSRLRHFVTRRQD
ncbi:hypothetical protein CRENBAI_000840 [Crenichthys baileyi]|uniref:Uncharacterized protein n=1 Tax=Crenichthys baileyi TaxID=28760 RepID=A0AAV9S8X6_9TELE